MNISFGKAVSIFGLVILTGLAAMIALYYFLESRPIEVEPIAVYGSPAEIFEGGRLQVSGDRPATNVSEAYNASTYSSAVSAIEAGPGLDSYEGQAFLRASAQLCEGYDPELRAEEWMRSPLYPEVEGRGDAMRSLQMVVYFQSIFCDGVPEVPSISDRSQLLDHVSALAERSLDADTLEILILMSPVWEGVHPDDFDLDVARFEDLASSTGSP